MNIRSMLSTSTLLWTNKKYFYIYSSMCFESIVNVAKFSTTSINVMLINNFQLVYATNIFLSIYFRKDCKKKYANCIVKQL